MLKCKITKEKNYMKLSLNDKNSIVKNNWIFPIEDSGKIYDCGEDIHISIAIENYVYFLKLNENKNLEEELMQRFNINSDVAQNLKNKVVESLLNGLMDCLSLLKDTERDNIIKSFEYRLICFGYEKRREALFNNVYKDSQYFKNFLEIKNSYNNECKLYDILYKICYDSIDSIEINSNVSDFSLLFLKECWKKGWSFKDVKVPDFEKLYYHNTGKEVFIVEILSNYLKLNQLESVFLLKEEADERLNQIKEFCKPAFKQLYNAIMENNIEVDYLSLSVVDLDFMFLTSDMPFEDIKASVQSLINKLYTSESYFPGVKIIEDMLSLFYLGEYSFFNEIPKFKNGFTGSYIRYKEEDEGTYCLTISKHKIMIMQDLSFKRVYGPNGITSFFEVLEGTDITSPISIYFETMPSIFTDEKVYNTKINTIERISSYLKDGYVDINNEIIFSAKKEGIDIDVQDNLSLMTFKTNTIAGVNLIKEIYEIILRDGLRFSKNDSEVQKLRQVIDDIVLKHSLSLTIDNKDSKSVKKARKF